MEVADDIRTWDDLCAYLERTHREVKSYPGGFVRLTYPTDDGKGMPIGVYTSTTYSGKPWLVAAIKLGSRDDVRPRPALIANSDLPIGALAAMRDQAILRQSLPLGGLAPALLERTLRALANLAAEVRAAKGDVIDDNEDDDEPVDSPYAFIYR